MFFQPFMLFRFNGSQVPTDKQQFPGTVVTITESTKLTSKPAVDDGNRQDEQLVDSKLTVLVTCFRPLRGGSLFLTDDSQTSKETSLLKITCSLHLELHHQDVCLTQSSLQRYRSRADGHMMQVDHKH